MQVLVLGGTRFLGRHFAEGALAAGHAPTLFHRGRTGADLFPDVEHVLGDRDGGLDALSDRSWDAVVDCCGYVPRVVAASARLLRESAGQYLFVSSISAYAMPFASGADESHPLAVLRDPSVEAVTGETYGGLKAACEREVQSAFGQRALVVRPGLIVGPHDSTDRFPYWPRRLARGGDVLVPDVPLLPVQVIDVRDLAAWMLRLLERRVSGTFNAVGPGRPLVFREFLERVGAAVGSQGRLTWVAESFLLEHGVEPWLGLPLWVTGDDVAHSQVDHARARAEGLEFRAIEETARDTLAWDRARPAAARATSPALAPEREAELLAAWAARSA